MFGYFYPENNERFLPSLSFATAEEARAWFRDKRRMWSEIQPSSPSDHAAFQTPILGDIVVVRALSEDSPNAQ